MYLAPVKGTGNIAHRGPDAKQNQVLQSALPWEVEVMNQVRFLKVTTQPLKPTTDPLKQATHEKAAAALPLAYYHPRFKPPGSNLFNIR